MTTAGWIFMVCSIGLVVSLVTFCFYRVLSQPETSDTADTMHAPLEIDTRDRDT